MPTVICAQNHVTHWRNQRGTRQPATCPQCGGATRKAMWDAGRYVQPQPKEPRTRVRCYVCGRLRLAPGFNVRRYEQPLTVRRSSGNGTITIPPGEWVCWYHGDPLVDEPLPPPACETD